MTSLEIFHHIFWQCVSRRQTYTGQKRQSHGKFVTLPGGESPADLLLERFQPTDFGFNDYRPWVIAAMRQYPVLHENVMRT
jgi:hypothetical protein